jgi:hypothetical protein
MLINPRYQVLLSSFRSLCFSPKDPIINKRFLKHDFTLWLARLIQWLGYLVVAEESIDAARRSVLCPHT